MDACQFYISCERVFEAALHKKPSIVLSNNDGNIVALSPEARALGLRRGQPFFQCQEIIREHGVQVYSSNYVLYGHMSAKMMATLRELTPRVEVYSIDEAFAELADPPIDDLTEFGQTVRQRIYQYTGLPVRLAFAPSKGLTKIGCELLKENPQYENVLDLTAFTVQQLEEALTQVKIEDVWGIGRKYARFLRNYGIATARDLRDADERWIRRQLTVVGARIQLELRGIACLPLEPKPPPRRQMINAKSFGRAIESREEMEEALSTYIARLGEKLREQDSLAARITIFLHTNGFDTSAEQYSNEFTVELPHATAFTPTLIKHALAALRAIYRKGHRYKRVGVMLGKITPFPAVQLDLFGELSPYEYERQARFMYIVDALNRIMGPGTLTFAIQGTTHRWGMHQEWLSQRYTSRWDELPTIR